MGRSKLEDWYLVPASHLAEYGGRRILRKYNENLAACLRELYPNHEWFFWKFPKSRVDLWKSAENQKLFVRVVCEENGFGREPSSRWHKLGLNQIIQAGGKPLLDIYEGSIYGILSHLFPDQTWDRWSIDGEAVPVAFFRSEAGMSQFLTSENTKRSLGITSPEMWYNVSSSDLVSLCCAASQPSLAIELSRRAQKTNLGLRKTSWLAQLLREAYGDKFFEWLDWKFVHAQPNLEFWSDRTNVKNFFYDIAKISSHSAASSKDSQLFERLQSLTRQDIRSAPGGTLLLSKFEGSAIKAIQFGFPESEQAPWRFNKVPNGFWDDTRNQRAFFEWCEKELGLESKSGWYTIPKERILELGGFSLLLKHKKSLTNALKHVFSEHDWQEWKFQLVTRGFWDVEENQRKFLDFVLSEESEKRQSDAKGLELWYSIPPEAVNSRGGQILLSKFGHSLRRALESVYSAHTWHPWLFQPQNQNIWNDSAVQRAFFDWLAPIIGVKTKEDWYGAITAEVLQKHRASSLMAKYNLSPTLPLIAAYPEHEWHEWKFRVVPPDFWLSLENRKRFFLTIAKEMDITEATLEKWYSVTVADVASRGGGSMLSEFYNNSLSQALEKVYPHHLWENWKFVQQNKRTTS